MIGYSRALLQRVWPRAGSLVGRVAFRECTGTWRSSALRAAGRMNDRVLLLLLLRAASGDRLRGTRQTLELAGLPLQLFLPTGWTLDEKWPCVVFLHGSGDGDFEVMNSQSLPRLLSPDQSTSFDRRRVWSFEWDGRLLKNESFARDFPFVVAMPQGWTSQGHWSAKKLTLIQGMIEVLVTEYAVDRQRIALAGQSAGGVGAWTYGFLRPDLWSALVIVCGAPRSHDWKRLDGKAIWIFHASTDVAMPVRFADDAVRSLRRFRLSANDSAPVRYTRYPTAPPPPDPRYNSMTGHASYDLAFRDPNLYAWLLEQHSSN